MRRKNETQSEGLPNRRWFGVLGCLRVLRGAAREDGAAIVEMALSCMILFGMLISIVEVSLALYAYDYTSEAAREAARWAIVRGALCSTNTPGLDHCGALNSDIQNFVQGLGFPYSNTMTTSTSYLTGTVDTDSNGNLITDWSSCSGNVAACALPHNQVTVTVTSNFPVRFFFWRSTSISLQSSASMVISQ
jgi:Flp pilus assembly protein TadG